jgi:hypothetical protein
MRGSRPERVNLPALAPAASGIEATSVEVCRGATCVPKLARHNFARRMHYARSDMSLVSRRLRVIIARYAKSRQVLR